MTALPSQSEYIQKLKGVQTLSEAQGTTLEAIAEACQEVNLSQGQTLLRAGVLESHAFVLLKGSLRLLAKEPFSQELFTVGRVGENELVGIVGLLRQGSCEACIAREACLLLSIPIELLLEKFQTDLGLSNGLKNIQSPCEEAVVIAKILEKLNPPPANAKTWILDQINASQTDGRKILSSVIDGYENLVGQELQEQQITALEQASKLPLRFITWTHVESQVLTETSHIAKKESKYAYAARNWKPQEAFDLSSVGLREESSDSDLEGFKPILGKGVVSANLATLRMIASAYNIPCPVDVLERMLEGAVERAGSVAIEGMGQLAESMGLQTQIGEVKLNNLHRLELPVMVAKGDHYALMMKASKHKETILIADPEKGWIELSFEKARKMWGDSIKIVLIKRLADTPKRKFGWSWFTPVIKRFRWQLIQVLIASLFIQLFQLANPLLLQQIIDKVINQSNLSALQVLGAALVLAALFQGLLTAVRTWLLIDTTDRMDLLLGSQVIDKLLRLPLRFFERRPVGELSQRLSELSNLRGFLTGTAITSALDVLFAVIYIFIMLLYSPLLTAVALGTVPIYIGLVVFIAPIYRKLIRSQAQYAAKTQSHLIETLSGIQTVKAQHYELNSRWRWQERYSGQIAEGFKSVVLGTTAGETGNFLNQLSSLLIIWVGVYMVINGKLSLGQLIAFRIIAGYVTGPILRLSSLWQGFQQVAISMERLSDIVDQVPEAGEADADQISLPPIIGNIKFEDLKFRFGSSGPYQINDLSIEIEAGSFIGIVGVSGSGKSTLMKLLPRLYSPDQGRILIDGYDIDKVNLYSVRQQIGIVPQECLLFDGTIRENISMNAADSDTGMVIKVARAAAAHDFIMELPDGYGTRIGERGSGLSGGQRQRIAIARTLLQNPKLMILDEATSALDYDTEATVCNNLQESLGDKTVFFITHRLSTVRMANKIILMHEGRIAEHGTHDELMKLGCRYATLYAHQGDI